MRDSRFSSFPSGGYHELCDKAARILRHAHLTASALLDAFEESRGGGRGTTTDAQQDLLRAMLTFASSGLDATIKQLVKDALPTVIDERSGAQDQFRRFVQRQLRSGDAPDYAFVAAVMADPDPRRRLKRDLVSQLTSRSLQSVEEVLSVGSHFDIRSGDLIPDMSSTKDIFSARNQIVHEMDIDLAQPNRNRRPRRLTDMQEHTDALFQVASRFLTEVNARLTGAGPASTSPPSQRPATE